jgi:hypothetical protein
LKKVAEAEEHLSSLREEKQRVQEEGTMVRIFVQQDNTITSMTHTRSEIVRVEGEIESKKAELEEMRRLFYDEGMDSPFESAQFEDQTGTLRVLTDLRVDLSNLEKERVELLTRFTDQHPAVLSLTIGSRI